MPRADVGLFTLGALPRTAEAAAALQRLADEFVHVLDGRPRSTREIAAALPDLSHFAYLRAAAVTGRLHIRWDASTITVIPAEPPDIDAEEARLELARRFLHWHGPAGPLHLARWAGVTREDARATWARLGPELVPVSVAGRARWLLAVDQPALAAAARPTGVRLLPMGDPYLSLDRDLLEPPSPPAVRAPAHGPAVTRRLRNSLTGRLLVDGELVGAWGRVRADVTLAPWQLFSEEAAGRVASEVAALAGPLGRPPRVRWLEPSLPPSG